MLCSAAVASFVSPTGTTKCGVTRVWIPLPVPSLSAVAARELTAVSTLSVVFLTCSDCFSCVLSPTRLSTHSDSGRQPQAAPAAAKAPAGSVAFPPALAQKLEDALGSAQKVAQLSKRTELFARGGISAQNYWSTLKDVSSLGFLVVATGFLVVHDFPLAEYRLGVYLGAASRFECFVFGRPRSQACTYSAPFCRLLVPIFLGPQAVPRPCPLSNPSCRSCVKLLGLLPKIERTHRLLAFFFSSFKPWSC